MDANSSELTPAYILHRRSYLENSFIVDFFTLKFGRLSAVARGARGSKKKAALQLFSPFLISFAGAGELKTLKNYEIKSPAINLAGENLLIGMYINELLVRLMGHYDPMPSLYAAYEEVINNLSRADVEVETLLRHFEFGLLEDLGYGLVFDYELASGKAVVAENFYSFNADGGFLNVPDSRDSSALFSGRDLLAIALRDFTAPATRLAAKKIVRSALQPLLGGRALNSKALFVKQGRQER